MKIERKHKPEVVIPVAAMADIAFLLIIFFLVTSTLVKESGLDIELPRAEESQERKQSERNVAVDSNGAIYWNVVRIGAPELEVKLSEVMKSAANAEERVISVKGDERAAYGVIVTVLDVITRVGGRIALISETGGSGADEAIGGGAPPAENKPAPAPPSPPAPAGTT